MIKQISALIPSSIRNILRPFYHRLSPSARSRHNLGRDWDLDIAVPDEMRNKFLNSVIRGTTDFTFSGDKTNILLCAQPKSASLYITHLLSRCFEFKNHQIGFNKGGGPIYYPRLLAAKFTGENTISHCHSEPIPNVMKMIENLNFRPLVLTRKLVDTLASRRNMLLRDQWANEFLSKKGMSDFVTGSNEYQMDVTIELFAGSYINFYTGWNEYRKDTEIKPIFITYSELMSDEVGMVKRIADEFGLSISSETIEGISTNISSSGGINRSAGITQKGEDVLSERQILLLKKKAKSLGCYDEDFLGFDF